MERRDRPIRWSGLLESARTLGHVALPESEGPVLINEYLEVSGWPGVGALGGYALVPDPKTGEFHSPTGQHALRKG